MHVPMNFGGTINVSARFCLCPFCRRRLSPLWLAIILIAAQFLHSPRSRLHPLPILIFLLLRTSWLLTSFGFMPKNSAAETKADQSFVFECHTYDFPMKTFDFASSPEWLVQQYLALTRAVCKHDCARVHSLFPSPK